MAQQLGDRSGWERSATSVPDTEAQSVEVVASSRYCLRRAEEVPYYARPTLTTSRFANKQAISNSIWFGSEPRNSLRKGPNSLVM